MALKVIGAGFGRTGTESLKRALEMLGFGPCHHMYEILPDPDAYGAWERMVHGEEPANWDALYNGYSAAVDWPTCSFWQELSAYYPDAKVILSVRSADSWYRSYEKTILEVFRMRKDADQTRTMGYHLIANQTFGGRFDDPDHVKSVFEAHNQSVIDGVPPERLLVYNLGAGWGPLCSFLGVPVPEAPYPSGNAADEFHERNAKARAARQGPDA